MPSSSPALHALHCRLELHLFVTLVPGKAGDLRLRTPAPPSLKIGCVLLNDPSTFADMAAITACGPHKGTIDLSPRSGRARSTCRRLRLCKRTDAITALCYDCKALPEGPAGSSRALWAFGDETHLNLSASVSGKTARATADTYCRYESRWCLA